MKSRGEGRTRREILKAGGTLAAFGWALPQWVRPFAFPQGVEPPAAAARILVLVELAGGNDTLNTTVPFADDLYHKARPNLALKKEEVLPLSDTLGFHPSLKKLKEIYDEGQLAVVRSVGYPQFNRSHFEATEIYQSAQIEGVARSGWIGRGLEGRTQGRQALCTCRIGNQAPMAFLAPRASTLTLGNAEALEFRSNDRARGDRGHLLEAMRSAYAVPRSGNPYAERLQRAVQDAAAISDRLKETVREYKAEPYPGGSLASQLRLVAQMIDGGFGIQAYYASIGGFDTHANQKQAHANLLTQLGDAMVAFQRDLKAHGHGDRVLTMTFSEFGRRLQQNGSQGTDHGSAISMFLMGERVKGGVYGKEPDLKNLRDGDPLHDIDFRQVYASVIRGWWDQDPESTLGSPFTPIPLLSRLS